MSDHHVLVSCPLIQNSMEEYADRLAANGIEYDIAEVDQQLSQQELLEAIGQYDAILAGDDELDRQVLDEADRLEVIVKWGIGMDNIDEASAEEFGIEVLNTPRMFADEVADVVIGYVILLTRRLHEIDQAVRDGNWICPRGVSLRDRTFGIIGLGNIGGAVARRAAAHGMHVIGNDVHPLPDELTDDIDITPLDKHDLLAESDIVSLNCALNTDTRRMIGRVELDHLGEDGYLINTARGELVDQAALVEALEAERIAGVALDVFEEEPLPESSPLTAMDDVILGSHNAQNTYKAVQDVNDLAIEKLVHALVGGT